MTATNVFRRFISCRKPLRVIHSLAGLLLLTATIFPLRGAETGAPLSVYGLTCSGRVEPIGITEEKPDLSWKLASLERGADQAAYRILVASSSAILENDQGDLWDSGKVVSSRTQGIPYGGKTLSTSEACHWKVRVWNREGQLGPWSTPSAWTMGILSAKDWGGAQWIGAPVQAQAQAVNARAGRGYHAAEAARPDELKWVQLDLGQPRPISAIRLYPARHEGKDGFGFPVRFKVEASNDPDFKDARLIADQTAADVPNPGIKPLEFDAKGVTARYVRVTATRIGKFTRSHCFALSQIEVISGGVNVAKGATVSALDSVEKWGWAKATLTDSLIDTGKAASAKYPTVMLRREFTVKPGLRRAVADVCGLGTYEMALNGVKAGGDLFSPGWTKYDKTCLYDTCDITSLLHPGTNELGMLLGNGMYNVTGEGGRYTKFKGSYGPLKAIARVQLEYADGTSELLVTDGSWQASPGPMTFSSVYGGEDFDARWKPQWEQAKIEAGPGGELKGVSFAAPPIRTFDVLKAVKVSKDVYDLGQNASVIPRFTVKGPAGSSVKITPSELIKPDGEINDEMSRERGYWLYTLSGSGEETYLPKFYYRGARYLKVVCSGGAEVTGLEGIVVHSSATPIGEFACSNPLFNRIRTLIRWAQRSNMMSVLTDCPHREKLGWLEESYLNGPSLRYEFDLNTLFAKAMGDMADSQLDNGLVPDIAPEFVKFNGGFRDSPEWGSAVLQVAWQQYEFTGDVGLLRSHYDAMKRYVDYLGSRAKDHIIDYGLGDWYDIGPKGPGEAQLTPKALTATAIYYDDVNILARTARLLGREEDARRYGELAENIRKAFRAKYSKLPDSQTGRAMPLVVGLVDSQERPAVIDALVQDVREKGLTAGDVGYRYLLRALADGGRSDVIYALNNQSDKPGYGYQLKNGATSLTEAWNGKGHSQNHFMLGQINEWFFHDIAGIRPDSEKPGFAHIIIKPTLVGDLTWAGADYDSVRGRIASWWKRDGGRFTLDVSIPPGCTATVVLPCRDSKNVTDGGHPVSGSPGVLSVKETPDGVAVEIASGNYAFACDLPASSPSDHR